MLILMILISGYTMTCLLKEAKLFKGSSKLWV